MTDLEKLAEALPPIENNDHLKNLMEVHDRNQWHGVFKYVCDVKDIETIESTNNKNKFITRLKNAWR